MMLPMLLGGGGGSVVEPFPVTAIEDEEVFPAPGTALAALHTGSDGTITVDGNSSAFSGLNWYLPTSVGIGSSYWIRVTKTAGVNNTSGSALSAWLAMSAALFWAWAQSGMGSKSAIITVEIATDALGTNIVASRTGISVLANVTP